MTQPASIYRRHRFPPAIIPYVVWLYHRFNLSHRDIEDLLAERGIGVSYDAIRLWCNKFGPLFSKRLKRRHPGFGDTFFIDELFVTIAGQRHYLWRTVDNANWCRRPSTGYVGPARLNVGTERLRGENGERLPLVRCR